MDQNDYTCIKQVTKTVQLTMPLKYASNEMAGVTEILDSWKRQFVPKLQGVVVNYRDIRLARRTFFIHVSRTAPRYDVTATFDLFCPSIGDIVKGQINRTSREHIGCLIEGTIYATIHLPSDSSPNLSKFIRINRDILFQINRFEFNRHTIRVNGQITPECIKLMEESFSSVEDDKSNGLTNSMLNVHDGDGTSSWNSDENSGDQSSNKLESVSKNPATNLKLDSSSNSDTSSDESKLCENSIVTSTLNESYKTAILASVKEETETDSYGNPSTHSPNLKISKKRKRDSESSSLNSPKSLKKKRKKSEVKLKNEISLSDASESLTPNTKEKKKRKKISTLGASAIHASVTEETETDSYGNPSTHSLNVKISKKRKRDSESSSLNCPKSLKKKRKKSKVKLENETLLSDASESLTPNTKKQKKRKEKSTLSEDLASNMLNAADFESKFASFGLHNSSDTLLSVKREVVSTNSPVSITEKEKKGKKRKRESSTSSVHEDLHKSEGTKKSKKSKHKKSKSEHKKSKSKGKLVTAGDILKKDKKKSKSTKSKKMKKGHKSCS